MEDQPKPTDEMHTEVSAAQIKEAMKQSNVVIWQLIVSFLNQPNGEKLISGLNNYVQHKGQQQKRDSYFRLIVTFGITGMVLCAGYLKILDSHTVGTLVGGIIGFVARGYFSEE